MNDQFNNNESEVIQPNIGNTVNDVVTPEPVREAPRKARSVSSEPEEVTSSPKTVRPAARRSTPRARRMSLSLTRVDAWSVAKVTFMLSIAGAIIQIVA
ncbi:DUF3566 domain-containing protein, partial [Bifidobacterium breve]